MGFWNGLRRYAATAGANADWFAKAGETPAALRYADPVMVGDTVEGFQVKADSPRMDPQGWGEKNVATVSRHLTRNPLKYAGGAAGGLLVNAVVGNPLGGTIDAITGGATNLKADALPSMEVMPQARTVPPSYQHASAQQLGQGIPPLSADDLRRQVQYYQRRIRTDLETLKALEGQHYQANLLGTE